MPSFIATAVQSALLKSSANLLVQIITQWREKESQLAVDWQRVIEFAIFGLIQAQLNWWWQQFLEDILPTRTAASNSKEGQKTAAGEHDSHPTTAKSRQRPINKSNVVLKLVLDQTLGLLIMNTAFVVCTTAARLRSVTLISEAIQEKTLGVIFAAWKIWPLVSVGNFLWVPVESRVLVSSVVGFGWNMFLAFKTATS